MPTFFIDSADRAALTQLLPEVEDLFFQDELTAASVEQFEELAASAQ